MFRFSIRDLLWLTVVVALSLAWWVHWQSLPQADKSITGAITVAGQPLKDGRIYFYRADGQFLGAFVSNGRFRFERLPVGTYQVTIMGENVPPLYSDMKTEITDRTKALHYGLHSAEQLARMADWNQ
jgi:hypothetical protein